MKRILENKIKRRAFSTRLEACAHVDLYCDKGYISIEDKTELYILIDQYYPIAE